MIGNVFGRQTQRSTVRVGVAILLLGVLLASGFVTTAEASCEENFDECEGSLDPLTDSLSAINTLALTVLRLGGLVVLMGGLLLWVSSQTGVGTKKQARGAVVGGLCMLFLYFAQDALFRIIDFIVNV